MEDMQDMQEVSAQSGEESGRKKSGFFQRLFRGLTKTRDNIVKNMDYVFRGFTNIDEDFYEELEETLIMGDLGVAATERILDDLREKVKQQHIKEPMECRQLLIDSIKEQMDVGEAAYRFEEETSVILVVGVNGVGKTTTIGKLASKLKAQGKKVLVAGADTFRAAAGEQLKEWADRCGVDMIGGQEGSDPSAVVFDAVAAAKARKCDVLLIDTAGRLHNKKNLMEELRKMNHVISREFPEAYRETLVADMAHVLSDGPPAFSVYRQAAADGFEKFCTALALFPAEETARRVQEVLCLQTYEGVCLFIHDILESQSDVLCMPDCGHAEIQKSIQYIRENCASKITLNTAAEAVSFMIAWAGQRARTHFFHSKYPGGYHGATTA